MAPYRPPLVVVLLTGAALAGSPIWTSIAAGAAVAIVRGDIGAEALAAVG